MNQNKFGEIILDSNDLFDLIMQGHNITKKQYVMVDESVDLEKLATIIEDPECLLTWTFPFNSDKSIPDYDSLKQRTWHMPEEFKNLDIAEYVLSLCTTQEELQRVGEELLMFQSRNMFDLLRYLHYLVTVMRQNHVIWGVGRGSSVASYVLYLLGVHKINSMYYDLSPAEFLR